MTTDFALAKVRRIAGNAVSRNRGDTRKAGRELAQELVQEHVARTSASSMLIALCIDYLDIITINAGQ